MPTKNIINTGNLKSDFFVRANIGKMETSADFGGTVIQTTYIDPSTGLSFLLNHLSLPYAIPYSLLVPSEENLRKTYFDKFKSNFIRANIAEPGKVSLFDETEKNTFIHNCGVTARLALNSRVLGIFIDTEAYSGSTFWRYSALPSIRTFSEYQQKYEEVGTLVGQEITKEFPTIKLAIAVSFEQLRSVPALNLPIDRYGLLPSFLNGLYNGVGRDVRIINTLEDAYANQTVADFDFDMNLQVPRNVPYLTSTNYSNVHIPGLSTWCDYPGTGFDFNDLSKNYNTPEKFENNIKLCAERVDWIFSYSQQLNWHTPVEGVNAPPEPYLRAISNVARNYVIAHNSSIIMS